MIITVLNLSSGITAIYPLTFEEDDKMGNIWMQPGGPWAGYGKGGYGKGAPHTHNELRK